MIDAEEGKEDVLINYFKSQNVSPDFLIFDFGHTPKFSTYLLCVCAGPFKIVTYECFQEKDLPIDDLLDSDDEEGG